MIVNSAAVECLRQTVGGLLIHHMTVFVCQLVRKKYMERILNCERINAEHSEYKIRAGHKRSRTPTLNSFLVTLFENVLVGLTQYPVPLKHIIKHVRTVVTVHIM